MKSLEERIFFGFVCGVCHKERDASNLTRWTCDECIEKAKPAPELVILFDQPLGTRFEFVHPLANSGTWVLIDRSGKGLIAAWNNDDALHQSMCSVTEFDDTLHDSKLEVIISDKN